MYFYDPATIPRPDDAEVFPMNSENEKLEDERWSALFSAADNNSAQPDDKYFNRLREQSAREFLAHNPPKKSISSRRRRMFIFTPRGITVTAATLTAAAIIVLALLSPAATAVPADKIFSSLDKAQSLHLNVTRDGETGEVWTQKPDRLRWNNADGTYEIAKGKQLWRIDEKANQAASAACTYFREVKAAAAAGRPCLWTFSRSWIAPCRAPENPQFERAAQNALVEGKPFEDYRLELPGEKGKITVRVLIDAATQCLSTVEATNEFGRGVRPFAKLTVVSIDQPAPEDLFVVGDTLTEDGRIGKVTDVQGMVAVKPVMAERWTPVVCPSGAQAGRLDPHRSARRECRRAATGQADRRNPRSRLVWSNWSNPIRSACSTAR